MANHRKEIFFDRRKKDHFLNHMFFGYDMDRTMLRIGAMNMMTHGVDSPTIEYRDSLSDQNPDKDKFDLILANPPFKGSLDADTVSADLLKVCKTKKTNCCSWRCSCGCCRQADGAPALFPTACYLVLPLPIRPSGRSWWRATGWRR